jgi:hypothetical protein
MRASELHQVVGTEQSQISQLERSLADIVRKFCCILLLSSWNVSVIWVEHAFLMTAVDRLLEMKGLLGAS